MHDNNADDETVEVSHTVASSATTSMTRLTAAGVSGEVTDDEDADGDDSA